MSSEDITRLLGKVSSVLDDDDLWNLEISIDWEALYEIYKLDGIVGYYNNGYFNRYEVDVIVRNLLKKDLSLFKTVITYISNRYGLPILEEYLNEYSELFEVKKRIDFKNNRDKNNLKMFISFSNKDGKEAEKIQKFFKTCGLDCFLSKTNMEISDEYKNKIYQNILDADIFIYLLSEESKSSDWCDQEMGMAFMKYKFEKSILFVVSNDGTIPYGFLSSFHAGFTYEANYLTEIARKIDEKFDSSLIDSINQYQNDSLNLKIKELFTVKSFNGARDLLVYINHNAENLNEKQLEMICNASLSNNQIYGAFICQEPVNRILSKHKDKIDDELYQEVFKKINH